MKLCQWTQIISTHASALPHPAVALPARYRTIAGAAWESRLEEKVFLRRNAYTAASTTICTRCRPFHSSTLMR